MSTSVTLPIRSKAVSHSIRVSICFPRHDHILYRYEAESHYFGKAISIKFYMEAERKNERATIPSDPKNISHNINQYHTYPSFHLTYAEQALAAAAVQVLNPLGKGSFGQVVRSFDFKTNNCVALKMVPLAKPLRSSLGIWEVAKCSKV